jgi:hypothetical protein
MTFREHFRPWLVLGRVSNLPTVWSNCFAAWLLAGGGMEFGRLALLCAGATAIYIGGMFLNDAFDANFDAQHRRERPIPSGALRAASVWRAGFASLALGLILIMPLGWTALINGVLLVAFVLVYDAVHKLVTFSPVFMAGCRFFLYTTSACAAAVTFDGRAVWTALALGSYICGLSFLARRESTGMKVQTWSLALLAAPLLLATLINDGAHWRSGALLTAIVLLWIVRSLRPAFSAQANISRAVSGLLAGIPLVDFLAVADAPREQGAVFIALFLLALLFQRFVPAT